MRTFIISLSLSVTMAMVWASESCAQNEASRADVFQWLRQARGAALAGEKDKVRKLIEDSRTWAADHKDTLAAAWAEQLAGEVEFSAGDQTKATKAFQAALVAFTELKNQAGMANSLLNLGRLALGGGKTSEAEEHLSKALELFR
ncbi:MAG TPA: tetratricopeptide repeat protein, partial [Gemmataceae bacterium]|nr:tetratricopeptide repeat protein [Gemmataceae bacterium]